MTTVCVFVEMERWSAAHSVKVTCARSMRPALGHVQPARASPAQTGPHAQNPGDSAAGKSLSARRWMGAALRTRIVRCLTAA